METKPWIVCSEDPIFEALTAVMFQVEIFWVTTPCSIVVG
jgi:hypothetical protein